jgi:hypothetical protein
LSRSFGKLVRLEIRVDRRLPNELRGELDDLIGPRVDRAEHAINGRSR